MKLPNPLTPASRGPQAFWRRIVFLPEDLDPRRAIITRFILVVFLLTSLMGILWIDREGLYDQSDHEISFGDVVYFTMVTITTVGYGDIVPVSPRARWIDAIIITPLRILIWVLFLGTAYQLAFRQFTEVFRMAKLQTKLQNHIIVCGFGHTGYSTVKELLTRGIPPEHILVVDSLDERIRAAVELGVIALRGDAGQESILKEAACISMAKTVIITAGRDEINALILLTVRHLNPACRVMVSAKEEENVKLFRQGGAQTIISPATYGGYMLAAAVKQHHLTDYLEDLLTTGGLIDVVEREISDEDAGKSPKEFFPDIVLRIYRHGVIISPVTMGKDGTLEKGDVIILLQQNKEQSETT